ncbi:MAG TPA: hypothetical protein VHQ02_04420 [Usitatibacter sp.]|jgi:hypothetical protein|nr:hypothetical protein [Usitatibacter sp.]
MRVSRAALAALLVACAAQGAELGTLFFTPAEREAMDRERRGEPPPASASAPREAGGHAVTGYVKRTDGRATVWIDGRPVTVSDPKSERLLDPRAVSAYSRDADDVKVERKR